MTLGHHTAGICYTHAMCAHAQACAHIAYHILTQTEHSETSSTEAIFQCVKTKFYFYFINLLTLILILLFKSRE